MVVCEVLMSDAFFFFEFSEYRRGTFLSSLARAVDTCQCRWPPLSCLQLASSKDIC